MAEAVGRSRGIDYLGNVVFINLRDPGAAKVLMESAGLHHLRQLHLSWFAVTDAGVAELRKTLLQPQVILDQTAIKNQTGSYGLRP